jgi:hypothetical protein
MMSSLLKNWILDSQLCFMSSCSMSSYSTTQDYDPFHLCSKFHLLSHCPSHWRIRSMKLVKYRYRSR